MSNDKLREAAEDVIAWFSKRAVAGWAESEDGLRINTLRAALADSADDGGVLGARTIERSVEPDTHGEASIDREVRPLSAGAPPEPTEEMVEAGAQWLLRVNYDAWTEWEIARWVLQAALAAAQKEG